MPTPFYSQRGLHVEIYDVQTADKWAALHNDETAFYVDEAKTSGGPVLELACGTGRLTLPLLLETGLEVYGLDASAAMLEMAEQKRDRLAPEISARLHLHLGDMAEFDLGQRFALVIVAFRSFQILAEVETQRRCLRCIRDHLAPNGRVILNLFDPRYDMMLPGRQEGVVPSREFTHPVTGNTVLVETLERVNDNVTQTFEERWRFTETNALREIVRQEEETVRLRWTFRYEMRHLVESCGFAVEAEYSDFHRSPPAYAKEQVWVFRSA